MGSRVRSEAEANLAEVLAFGDGRYSRRGIFHRATCHRIDGAEPVTLDGAHHVLENGVSQTRGYALEPDGARDDRAQRQRRRIGPASTPITADRCRRPSRP